MHSLYFLTYSIYITYIAEAEKTTYVMHQNILVILYIWKQQVPYKVLGAVCIH